MGEVSFGHKNILPVEIRQKPFVRKLFAKIIFVTNLFELFRHKKTSI
jgi:hypothetical protein